MPRLERPYEKCEERGASSLSDCELLAVLLRTGTKGENVLDLAERILYHIGENGRYITEFMDREYADEILMDSNAEIIEFKR